MCYRVFYVYMSIWITCKRRKRNKYLLIFIIIFHHRVHHIIITLLYLLFFFLYFGFYCFFILVFIAFEVFLNVVKNNYESLTNLDFWWVSPILFCFLFMYENSPQVHMHGYLIWIIFPNQYHLFFYIRLLHIVVALKKLN